VSAITPFPKSERNNLLSQSGKRYFSRLKEWPKVPKNRVRINSMAASITNNYAISVSASSAPVARVRHDRRRRISPQAGHALEILGHAIEYLTDEFIHEGHLFSPSHEQLEAVQLLMALNRQIYFECPEQPTLGERCRKLLRLRAA
jgi:hypothetical protein